MNEDAFLLDGQKGRYIEGGNGISDEGAIAIADALSTNGSLKYLDLENNIRISEQTRNVIASTIRADITFVH